MDERGDALRFRRPGETGGLNGHATVRMSLSKESLVPTPKATDVRTFIPCKDFERSKRFYAALGWATEVVGPGLALVTLADEQNFYLQDYYVKDFAENTMLHISVKDAPAWHAHIAAVLREQEFPDARVQPPKRQDYGASVVFVHDPSGVLLHLCQWDD